jgi:hypothetical protein
MAGAGMTPRQLGDEIRRRIDGFQYRLALTEAALEGPIRQRDHDDEDFLRWVYEISGGAAKAEDALLTEIMPPA